MKFTTPILALALGAQASLVERDLATIQKVLSDISSQVNSLDTAVKAFSGDAQPLISASTTLLSTIQSGTSTVQKQDVLSLLDASTVAQSVTTLNSSVAAVVSDLISKKAALAAAGFGGAILTSLQDQKSASQALATALTSKVPTTLQAVASELSQGIADSLSAGIAAFQGTGGTKPTSTSTAGSISSTTGPTPTSSTAATTSVSVSTTSTIPIAPTGGYAQPTLSVTYTPPAVFPGAAIANGVDGALAVVAAAVAVFAL